MTDLDIINVLRGSGGHRPGRRDEAASADPRTCAAATAGYVVLLLAVPLACMAAPHLAAPGWVAILLANVAGIHLSARPARTLRPMRLGVTGASLGVAGLLTLPVLQAVASRIGAATSADAPVPPLQSLWLVVVLSASVVALHGWWAEHRGRHALG